MTQEKSSMSGTGKEADEKNLLDLLIVLAKYKTWIIGLPLVASIAAGAVSYALPNVYKATTKLVPPQQPQSSAAALLSQIGGGASLAGLKNSNDLYIGMLKSRTVADRLIGSFQLEKVYETTSVEGTRKALEGNTTIAAGKEGLITIEVEDRDRKRAANLANAYVSELLRLSKVLAVTEASQRRLFFEQQLETAKNNLANAEVKLKGQLDTSGVVNVDAASLAVIETTGRVRAQISAKEIQLNSMRAFLTPSNPDYRRAEEELSSLRNELSRLENGRKSGEDSSGSADTRHTGFKNIQLLRDVKYFQMLYELLAKQYEIARLDEAKDPSIVQVLDPAVEPEHKYKPRRAFIVLVTGALTFAMCILWAFLLDAKQRSEASPTIASQWRELRSHLRLRRS
jgi:tyrosine-protein kinase Etk/Wzc